MLHPFVSGWEASKKQAALLDQWPIALISRNRKLSLARLVELLSDPRFQEFALEWIDGSDEATVVREAIAERGGLDDQFRLFACILITTIGIAGYFEDTLGASKAA